MMGNPTIHRAEGPFRFLNPTRAQFIHAGLAPDYAPTTALENSNNNNTAPHPEQTPEQVDSAAPSKNVRFLWRSRDNRKGRHPLLIQAPIPGADVPFAAPRRTSDPKEVARNIVKTLTYFPVWDISWLVGFMFTCGSVIWVINAFFAWLPLAVPATEFLGESYYGGGITAFVGAILFFEVGSVLLLLEAVNANNAACFGWAVEQILEDGNGTPKQRVVVSRNHCRHHHQNRRNLVGMSSPAASLPEASRGVETRKHWQWFPAWHDLRTHYLHELGFLAGSAQLFGATVFGISGITALPGIIDHLVPQWRLNAAYWIPQVIGGSGFIVSSTLYMLETQQKWWKPAPHLLGWHVAFWNLIGAFGFTLCGALGIAYGNWGAQYQASLATFW
ncbi:integral membrane protein [Metarhizium rileyi]|uniref:Integral membrane protein n=1 Tax=Metarhizium rileyi (strain RCEF 4871) TaxID=1649241 RepID=A0A162I030_METRR|nr:integral membrane protein [Metarhizium rileyi RCEF 4871]